MQFRLTIDMDNAAFERRGKHEVARLLRSAADRLVNLQADSGKLLDINGNTVGSWEIVE